MPMSVVRTSNREVLMISARTHESACKAVSIMRVGAFTCQLAYETDTNDGLTRFGKETTNETSSEAKNGW